MLSQTLRAVLLVLLTGLVAIFAKAQDPHYTQFYANQQMLNPAFAGAGAGPRVALNYRAQWVAIPGSYRQMALGYDMPLYFGRSVQGFGVLLQNDMAGEGNLQKLDILLNYSYAIQLGRTGKEHYLRLGLSGGVQQASINFFRLRFSDQIDQEQGFINATQEAPPANSIRFTPDVNAGLAWYNRFAYASFSVHHIITPNQNWIGPSTKDDKLPMRFTGTAGINLPIGGFNNPEKVILTPAVLFMKQRNFNQLALGAYVHIQPVVFGVWYRMNFNNFLGSALASDMIAGMVGWKKGVFSVGYSYDFTLSRLTNGISAGSHELSLIVEFDSEKKKRFKHRTMPCPRF